MLAFSADEGCTSRGMGSTTSLVAYPCVERARLTELALHAREGVAPVLMVDDAQVRLAAEVARARRHARASRSTSTSRSLPKLYFGVRRSPVRVRRHRACGRPRRNGERGVRLVGVMGYEAQIAGLPDATGHASDLAIRALKRLSFADVRRRRGAIVDALRSDGHPIRLVNGGGTGSLDVTSRDPSVTELAAGSGLFAPTSFDAFAGFRHRPAAGFALSVTRRPSPELVTCFGGGYVASGPPSAAKVPAPWLPEGLTLLPHEMAGEVQTPLRVPSEVSLAIGDPVFFRHAKAGELCERFARLLLISGDRVVDEVATYRGEGESFG
ncbi:MAG: hypothetical protein R3B99_30010 [Polyangiales bacterium]